MRRLAALGLVILGWAVVMAALEPMLGDGWFIADWLAEHPGLGEYAAVNRSGEVPWGNPRAGQLLTWLTYGPAHVAITPVIVLAWFALLLVHVRGRWPAAGDERTLLVIVALCMLAQPQLGPVLFYRPYAANYLLGLVVQLAWLVPYRFALERPAPATWPRVLAVIALGALAGACNEHTGPVLAIAAAIVAWRVRRAWLAAGVIAFVAGYLALMLAPAQGTRYCGTAELSALERIADRDLLGTAKIVFAVVWAGRWAWLAAALALVAMRARGLPWRPALAWIAIGVAISWTLLASPKQGDRLLFAPVTFATLGVAMLVEARRAIAIAAGAIAAGAIAWSTWTAIGVAGELAEREALLAAAPRGSVVALPALGHGPSRWFLGDDLPSDSHRNHVAQRHGLAGIELAGHPTRPFHYAIRYRLDGEPEQLARRFAPVRPVCEARRELEAVIAAHGPRLRDAALVVEPQAPVLDGRELAASRWRAGRLIAPAATVVNEGYTRWIAITGMPEPYEVLLVGPGKTERLARDGGRWSYRPWGRGAYWIIACAGECYFVDAIHHTQV